MHSSFRTPPGSPARGPSKDTIMTPASDESQAQGTPPRRQDRTPPVSPIFTPGTLGTPSPSHAPQKGSVSPMSPMAFGLRTPSPKRTPPRAAGGALYVPAASQSPGISDALNGLLFLDDEMTAPEKKSEEKNSDKRDRVRAERQERQKKREKRHLDQQAAAGKKASVPQQARPKKRELVDEFGGPFRQAYELAYQTALEVTEQKKDYRSLGNVFTESDSYYFQVHAESKACATAFLKTFWKDAANRKAIIDAHNEKYARGVKARRTLSTPSCISFVNALLKNKKGNKKLCFISVSFTGSETNKQIWDLLIAFIKANRKTLVNDVKFILLDSASPNYHKLINDLTPDANKAADPSRECAEKSFCSNLSKLFDQYGSNLFITGVINCPFYPYENNKEYALGSTITLPNFDERVEIDETFYSVSIPCCANCQRNKEGILKTLLAAQLGSAAEAEAKASEDVARPNRSYLSPLKPEVANLLLTPPPKGSTPQKRSPMRYNLTPERNGNGAAAAAFTPAPMPVEDALPDGFGTGLLTTPLPASRHQSEPPFAIGALAAARSRVSPARAAARVDANAGAAAAVDPTSEMEEAFILPPPTGSKSARTVNRRLFSK